MEHNNEDDNNVVILNELCRICMGSKSKMRSLTNVANADVLELLTKLSKFANLELEINDTLPAYLCRSCEHKLTVAYDFQQLCRTTNKLIQVIVNRAQDVEEAPLEDDTEEPPSETPKESPEKIRRLKQFPEELVEEAIREAREQYAKKTVCGVCSFKSSNTRALAVHVTRTHKELNWCITCNVSCEDLEAHRKKHSERKCKFCGKTFKSSNHFFEHLAGHCKPTTHKCDVCKQLFMSLRALIAHYPTHANDRLHKCPYCGKHFTQNRALRMHLKRHMSYKCKDCERSFGSEEQYNGHKCFDGSVDEEYVIKLEEDEQEEKDEEELAEVPVKKPRHSKNFCDVCNKKVRSLKSHNLKFHLSKPKGPKPDVLCTYCGKQFKTNSKLNVHIRTHTGETPYKCSFCPREMSTRNQMVVHERIHTGEKPHVCGFCGKGFAQTSVLNTHLKLHTGRPEQCNICMKRFCRPTELRLHMRQHTGEKPFSCDLCKQSFKQKSHQVEHMKTHSNERPFQCHYCEKSFKQNSTLKAHLKIHTGHKPFKCSQCPYASTKGYSLNQHMLQHELDAPNPAKPHICCICHKRFSTNAMLVSHSQIAQHDQQQKP